MKDLKQEKLVRHKIIINRRSTVYIIGAAKGTSSEASSAFKTAASSCQKLYPAFPTSTVEIGGSGSSRLRRLLYKKRALF